MFVFCVSGGLCQPQIDREVKTEKFGRHWQTEKTDTGSLRFYELAFRNLCKEEEREGVGQGYLNWPIRGRGGPRDL